MTDSGDGVWASTADLAAVVIAVGLAAAVALSPLGTVGPVAIAVGVPFVLVVPGYALVSALFPGAGETAPTGPGTTSWVGRLGLSVGGSVVAVARRSSARSAKATTRVRGWELNAGTW